MQCQTDAFAGAGTVFDQTMSQAIGLSVQLAEAQALTINPQCQRIRRGGGLSSDLFVHQTGCG
ncbi:hypothetical protein D3C81_2181290 [compost metagenome]